ncbi:MAG: ATP-binding cassette domain-containing protein, partial [Sutterellaceae bacterium]|nr:ATP-binding cassette domain-containing protein [Sutterellaceae bacterium]
MTAINVPLIELMNAGIEFPGRRIAGISFNVTRGEFVCLLGPTGSGKSLALDMIAGLKRPSFGQVIVAGDCINDFNERQMMFVRRTMGIMGQELLLLNDRSILENVMLPAIAAEESYSEAKARAMTALNNCGIQDL